MKNKSRSGKPDDTPRQSPGSPKPTAGKAAKSSFAESMKRQLRSTPKWKLIAGGILILAWAGLITYGLMMETGEIEVDKEYDGGRYTGQWRWGAPGGEGTLVKDTVTYTGEWENSKIIYGTITTPDLVYRGHILDGRPDRYGSCTYSNGMIYYGMWSSGMEQGLGRLDYPDGSIDFGMWDDGKLRLPPGQKFKAGNRVYGLDISVHQPDVDWNDLALYCDSVGEYVQGKTPYLQPIFFLICKSTEGTTIQDIRFDERFERAKNHGLYVGAYHFLTSLSPIETQIQNFIDNTPLRQGDLPPILDMELPDYVMRRQKKQVLADAHRWLEAMERHYGVKPILYTYNSFYKNYLQGEGFDDYELWIARYSVTQLPDLQHWIIWQFTEKGHVQGITRTVDINRFRGSYRDFRHWVDTLSWKVTAPPPARRIRP